MNIFRHLHAPIRRHRLERGKRLIHGLATGLLPLLLATVTYGGSWEGTNSFSFTETYDDNPSRESNSSDRDRQEGTVTALHSGLTLHRITERSQLDLNHGAFQEFFYGHSRLNNMDQTGSLSYLYQISSRLRGGLTDSLRITEDTDTNQDPRGLRFNSARSRSKKRSNTLGLFLEPQLTPRLSARMDYTHGFTDVDVADESDETRNTLGVTLNYLTDIDRADTAYLAYNLSFSSSDENSEDRLPRVRRGPRAPAKQRIPEQIAHKNLVNRKALKQKNEEDNRSEDFRFQSLHLGYTRHLAPTLSLNLRSGLSWIASDSSESDGEKGWTGGMSLEKGWARTKFSLNLYRDVSPGGRRGRPTTSEGLSGSLSREFSPKLQVSLSGTYSNNESMGRDTRGNNPRENRSNREDSTYWSTGINLNYRPSDWWSATVAYHYSARDRNNDDRNREENLRESDQNNDTYADLNIGLHFDLSSAWKMDLGYAFSRRSDRQSFSIPRQNGRQSLSDREEDPERNRFWLTFTRTSPLKF